MMFDEKLLSLRTPGLDPTKVLGKRLCNQLQKHAVAVYPNECIGYVKDGKYFPLENVSNNPTHTVALPEEELLRVLDLEPDVICHSHPDGPDCPSGNDVIFQRQTAVPHAIVSTDGHGCLAPFVYGDMVSREPLLGRAFRYHVQDCYSLIRDFHLLVFERELKEFPREWEWWHRSGANANMYIDHFREAGFEQVEGLDLEVGDVLMIKAGAKVPNHGGIYLGNGLMLHHLAGRLPADSSRLSTIEPVVRWQQNGRIDTIVRYRGV